MPVPCRTGYECAMKHALITLLLLAVPAAADPVGYRFVPDGSQVKYRVDFGTDEIFGTMPVEEARIVLDFEQASNSSVAVTLRADQATASFPFAAQALKGPQVLATADFPRVTFETTAFRASGNTAEVDGNITIRGVTRPMTLRGGLFREQGRPAGERSELLVRLAGSVDRSAFGADGFADMVSDEVEIEILARMARAE